MQIPVVKVKKINVDANVPTLSNKGDAGLDLQTMEPVTLLPGKRVKLPTGLAMEIPEGMYGRIEPRSKLADKYGIDVLAGVVDATYRGEIQAVIINHGEDPVEFRKGDKIAQMVIKPTYSWLPLELTTQLSESERGSKGINDAELRLN